MSNERLSILVVDDNADNRDLLEDIFEDDFDVTCVASGQECLNAAAKGKYDLVLLDINMPGMDGYEVCRQLKANVDTAMIPIVFVSALASTEERLRGYEVGAEDYITKPFKDQEIADTVAKVVEHRLKTMAFEKQSKEAMSTAFQAMTNSAELGYIIQYLQGSYESKTIDELADNLLATTQNFGLNCCLMFRWRYQKDFYGCANNSIEAKVLDRFCEGERIVNFGARTLINDNHVSLLIKNMPLDKPEDYGRIKDNLTVLVSGTEARTKAIEIENQLDEERKGGLQAILLNSQDKLQEIHALIEKQESNTRSVINSISSRVEDIIFSLGLDESQEQVILSAIDSGVDELNVLSQFSAEIEQSFHRFIGELGSLAGN